MEYFTIFHKTCWTQHIPRLGQPIWLSNLKPSDNNWLKAGAHFWRMKEGVELSLLPDNNYRRRGNQLILMGFDCRGHATKQKLLQFIFSAMFEAKAT